MVHFCSVLYHRCHKIYNKVGDYWFVWVREQALDAMHRGIDAH